MKLLRGKCATSMLISPHLRHVEKYVTEQIYV